MKLKLNGIRRDKDCVSALALYFNRPVTDYEMRFLQEVMNRTLEISLPTERTGVVVLDASEYDELERCNQAPRKPTPSIMEGAEQLRKLYAKLAKKPR